MKKNYVEFTLIHSPSNVEWEGIRESVRRRKGVVGREISRERGRDEDRERVDGQKLRERSRGREIKRDF
jgi:hypothetical protein